MTEAFRMRGVREDTPLWKRFVSLILLVLSSVLIGAMIAILVIAAITVVIGALRS